MKSTAIWDDGSLQIGRPSSPTSTERTGQVIYREFFAGRALPLPNTRALGDVLAKFEQDADRRAAMAEARAGLSEVLNARRPDGLAVLRMRAGMSQAALAQAAGSSQAHIAKIESGKNDPGTGLIARIAVALGCGEAEVFRAVRADQTRENGPA